MNTIIFTMVVTEQGEGKEPAVSHSLTVNGKPVEGALAVISVGQLPGVFISGANTTNEMRELALRANGLAGRMYDAALGAVINKVIEADRKLAGEPTTEEGEAEAPQATAAPVPLPDASPVAASAA